MQREDCRLVVVAVALLVTACSANDITPTPSSSASPADPWGPLAVIPPQAGTDTARTEGTLRITDTCVSLDSPSGVMLLVWAADRTAWSAEPPTITFTNVDGTVVTVLDGDAVALGGSGDSEADGGLSGQEWVERTVWVAPPSPACSLEQRWFVGGVGR